MDKQSILERLLAAAEYAEKIGDGNAAGVLTRCARELYGVKADYLNGNFPVDAPTVTPEPVAVPENDAPVSGAETTGATEGSGDGGPALEISAGDAVEMKTAEEMAATFAPAAPTP